MKKKQLKTLDKALKLGAISEHQYVKIIAKHAKRRAQGLRPKRELTPSEKELINFLTFDTPLTSGLMSAVGRPFQHCEKGVLPRYPSTPAGDAAHNAALAETDELRIG